MKRFQIDTNSQIDFKSLKMSNFLNGPQSLKSNNKMNDQLQSGFSPKQMTPKQSLFKNKDGQLYLDSKLKFTPRVNSDQNILSKELLRMQIREKDYKPQKQVKNISWSSNELANAMQKYHQYIEQKNKQLNNDDQTTTQFVKPKKSEDKTKLLSQLVTKVNVEEMTNSRINIQLGPKKKAPLSKPPTPTQRENNSQKQSRPSTSELFQSTRLQQSSSTSSLFQPLAQSLIISNNIKKQPGRQGSEINAQKKLPQKSISITPTAYKSDNKYFEANRKSSQDSSIQNVQQLSHTTQSYYLVPLKKAFNKPLKEDYFSRLFRDHFYQTYQGVYFAQFLKPADPIEIKSKKVYLKKKEEFKSKTIKKFIMALDKITLIFDLDETLVHCNENTNIPSDIILNIQISKTESINAGINIRPYALEILRNLSEDFEIIVFTASHSCYASKVLDHLDPDNRLIQHRLYRDNCCMTTGGMYIKDLKVFGDRSLDQMVLVDNAAYSYAWQVDNGIPIIPYYDNKDDRELVSLEGYLKQMIGAKDVRTFNRSNLKLSMFNDPSGPQRVFEKLFGCTMEQ